MKSPPPPPSYNEILYETLMINFSSSLTCLSKELLLSVILCWFKFNLADFYIISYIQTTAMKGVVLIIILLMEG